MVLDGVLMCSRSHFSSTVGKTVEIRPSTLQGFSISPTNKPGIIKWKWLLTLLNMGRQMKFWHQKANINVTGIDAPWQRKSFGHSGIEILEPLTRYIIRYHKELYCSILETWKKEKVHVNVSTIISFVKGRLKRCNTSLPSVDRQCFWDVSCHVEHNQLSRHQLQQGHVYLLCPLDWQHRERHRC